ncbi:MAG: hypothetical protein IJ853_03430 [Rickettsiales bacterium]|nr:hypothetical protein [Rickettsiales bacterium]
MRLRAKCLVFLVFLLQSCYSVNSNYSLNKLKYGLSEEEIRKNVFSCEPAEKNIVDETKVVYVYYIHSSIFDLIFNSERFPYIGFYPINRTGKEYWLLVDKKDGLIKSGYAKNWNKITDGKQK